MKKEQNHALQQGYIRRYTLSQGKENGIRVIELDNGILRVLLNESKGLDIMQIFHKGTNMSFVSKNGFTAREVPFLKRFEGGMLYTCGLDSIGGREGYELHGSYHNTPAEILSVKQTESVLLVEAQTESTQLFGQNLSLKRTITLPLESENLYLDDVLVNRGTKTEDYCLLYHINLGYPMLGEGLKISADLEEIIPRNTHSLENLAQQAVFPAPMDNEEERCYFLKNKGNTISAINQTLAKTFTLTYSKETLPCLIQWTSPATGDYALGLEPATSFLDDQFAYQSIQAGEEKVFSLTLSFCENRENTNP